MKYIRSFYSVLTLITVGLIVISGAVYAFVDDDRGTAHRNLGHHHGHIGNSFTSGSPQLW